MKLLVGLGNKGSKFYGTRHNLGFYFMDSWKEVKGNYYEDFNICTDFFRSKISDISILKPATGMNNSGIPLKQLLVYSSFNIHLKDIIIIHDDFDLPIGKFKISVGGSSRHNGVRSVLNNLPDEFTRVRVGIGKPPEGRAVEYVLEKFNIAEKKIIDGTLENLIKAIDVIIECGSDKAMNLFNRK